MIKSDRRQAYPFSFYKVTARAVSVKGLLVLAMAAAVLGPVGYSHAQTGDDLVILYTEQGRLVIELFPEDAPNHAANFASLAADGFYDGTLFHRIIPGFMIQGGDPNTRSDSGEPQSSWGTGGPATNVVAEFNDIMHNRGIVSMARSSHPDSAGSQFFVVHQDSNFLDGQYTVFGRLVTQESYQTLDAIASTETDPNDRPVRPGSVRVIAAEVTTKSQATASGIDLLEQDTPERVQSIEDVTGAQSGAYMDEDLNLSIMFPEGWVIQAADSEGLPDIVAVGPLAGILPPNIAVYAENVTDRSLDSIIESKLADLASYAERGTLEILNQERVAINDREAFVLDAVEIITIAGQPAEVRYQEVTLIASGTIYTFLYSNEARNFDASLPLFEESLQSFDVLEKEADDLPEPPFGGGCLIATAAFGSEMTPQIQQLRELRDNHLVQTAAGSGFVEWFNTIYYSFSPYVADYQRENPLFREMVRLSITPMISVLSLLNHASLDSEAEVVTYGTAAILLVFLSYLGPALLALYALRRTARRPPTTPLSTGRRSLL